MRLLLTGDPELSESQSTQDPAVGGEAKLQLRSGSPGTAGQARVPTQATYLPAGAWPLSPLLGKCCLFASVYPGGRASASEAFLRPLLPASAGEDKEASGQHRLAVGKPNRKVCKRQASDRSKPQRFQKQAHIFFTFDPTLLPNSHPATLTHQVPMRYLLCLAPGLRESPGWPWWFQHLVS